MDAGEGSDAERDVASRNVTKPYTFIFCEDARGIRFFENLARRFVGNPFEIKVKSLKGPFDIKGERVISAAAYSAHKIIVVLDAHGKQGFEDKIVHGLKTVVGENCKLSVVVCEHSIEDWLVANECIELKGKTALEYLKREKGYEKRHLPGYAERIKLDILKEKSPSFRKFFDSLLDP
jgi:hypothetical protein